MQATEMRSAIAIGLLCAAAGSAGADDQYPLGAEQTPYEWSASAPDEPPAPEAPPPAADAADPLLEVEEIVVWGEPERRTEAGLLEVRRRASTVSDSLSAQEMSRAPDSAASDAARRVVSVTI